MDCPFCISTVFAAGPVVAYQQQLPQCALLMYLETLLWLVHRSRCMVVVWLFVNGEAAVDTLVCSDTLLCACVFTHEWHVWMCVHT